jgi:Domain of unknown function (DUF397)
MEVTDLNWRKASYSNGGENCIEVANADGVAVRDTIDRQGPMLTFSAAAWQAFVGGLK